jgi:dihydroorotate dehydrogenase electron transfer subunit
MKMSLPRATRIVEVTKDSAWVWTFTLDLHLEAQPGQFVMVWLPGVDEKPFSLVNADPVRLTIARVGPFTTTLHTLRPGDRLWVRGPLGNGFSLPTASRAATQHGSQVTDAASPLPHHEPDALQAGAREAGRPSAHADPALLLIGGGYGVAPLHFLAQTAIARRWWVDVVIGAQTADDVVFADRFAALGARVEIATDDGSLGWQGFATEPAAALLDQERHAAIYACGPEAMLHAVEQLARQRRMPAQLSYERRMRCGFGVCGTCHHGGRLVCRDGPVFAFSESDPLEEDQ